MATPTSAGPTVAQLKDDIDSGRTGDKIAHPDPSLSPLGTDDEAAGTPNTPERIELARRYENATSVDTTSETSRGWIGWLIPLVVLAIVILVGAVYLMRR